MKQAVKNVDTYKHFLGLALALVTLLVILSTNLFLQYVESDTQEKLNSAFKVKSAISSLLSSIQDAETGQRGFLLTGKDKYLEPYQQAIITIDDYLSVLAEETQGNPIQQADISNLRLLTNQKLAELKETITLYNQGQQQEAYALVQSDQGKIFMEGIRKITSDMKTLEDDSLIESQRKLNEVLRFSYFSDFTTIIIFFILLYFSNASYRRTRDIKNNEIQLANLLEATTNYQTSTTLAARIASL
jgi:CHASE3 domain sensor protein